MIQRIQTIYLLFGLLGVLFLLTLPVAVFSDDAAEYIIKAIGSYTQTDNKSIHKTETYTAGIILTGFLTAGYLLTIFSYKNRKRQMVLCWILILLVFALSALIILKIDPYQQAELYERRLGIGAFLPTVSIIFTLLARHAIAKDEALVRSADRLR